MLFVRKANGQSTIDNLPDKDLALDNLSADENNLVAAENNIELLDEPIEETRELKRFEVDYNNTERVLKANTGCLNNEGINNSYSA